MMNNIIKKMNCVVRPINDLCNLNCTYCNTKYRYSHETFKNNKIDIKTLENLFEKMKQYGLTDIVYTWHGGEPLLLDNDFYGKVVELQQNIFKNQVKITNIIQTNGTLLTKERIEFFKKNNFFVGISIDGKNYEENSSRFKSEDDYLKLVNNLELAKSLGLDFSITMVLQDRNTKNIKELYKFIREINPKNGVIVSPLFLKESEQNILKNTFSDKKFENFLIEFYEEWKKDKSIKNNFINSVNMGLDGELPRLCFLSGRCKNFININGSGDMYSTCHENEKYYVGNINELSFEQVLQNHIDNHIKIDESIKNDTIYKMTNEKREFIPFQSKGCTKRIVNGSDYYINTYINFINYVNKNK